MKDKDNRKITQSKKSYNRKKTKNNFDKEIEDVGK
jgi:hypothetical protein